MREAEEQLVRYATLLNAEEHVSLTPDVVFSPDKTKVHIKTDVEYEVNYDGDRWYSCVVCEIVEPVINTDRRQYSVRILGYPDVAECVFYEGLRQWKSSSSAEYIKSGSTCHAVHPTSFLYEPATIVRLNIEGHVSVVFGEGEEPVSVPLSHIIASNQRFYPQLKKVKHAASMTPEEREQLRKERLERKRERIDEKKQMKADLIAQDANDWQSMMSDLGMTKKRKKF
ncbi:hypothetical protein AGDE_01171 [Angomonas deanei]|nr:hypothetical protein AGDE_01171 [Angomonas deanei]|eukprot:EPY42752.1 hypothetical protein AGDE_01171 [Angomonas deanei]